MTETEKELQEIIDEDHLSSDHERLWKTWDAIQILAESHISIHRKLDQLLSLLSPHTREVAEKAFEAARKLSEVSEFPIIDLEFDTFEDYLNSLNPEGK